MLRVHIERMEFRIIFSDILWLLNWYSQNTKHLLGKQSAFSFSVLLNYRSFWGVRKIEGLLAGLELSETVDLESLLACFLQRIINGEWYPVLLKGLEKSRIFQNKDWKTQMTSTDKWRCLKILLLMFTDLKVSK